MERRRGKDLAQEGAGSGQERDQSWGTASFSLCAPSDPDRRRTARAARGHRRWRLRTSTGGGGVEALGATDQWKRGGTCLDLPLVMVMGLSHEATSDTVVVATMGRGIYTLSSASAVLSREIGG